MTAWRRKTAETGIDPLPSLASMEGLLPVMAEERHGWPAFISYGASIRALYPGLLAAVTVALAASWLAQHYTAPVMLFALLIGMAFQFLHEEKRCTPGIDFASRSVLRLGVALLGLRITTDQIASLGFLPVASVLIGVATTIFIGMAAADRLGLKRDFGLLSGGAVAICGASAALAIASVLPAHKDSERDTILVVVIVTGLSTLAMIFYPIIVTSIGLDHTHAGIFLGATIHDVAQVVGAGYMISPETGDIATYVKLLRVAMLAPVALILSLALASRNPASGGRARPALPLFLVGFVILVAVNSTAILPKFVGDDAADVSRWALVTAIAALGMKTSLGKLMIVGWRPILLMLVETVWIALFGLASVRFLL